MWHWLGLHRATPPQPPPTHVDRDPDLDRVRNEQHDLISKVTSDQLRQELRAQRVNMQIEAWRREQWHVNEH
jgi:hypothetical protein